MTSIDSSQMDMTRDEHTVNVPQTDDESNRAEPDSVLGFEDVHVMFTAL